MDLNAVVERVTAIIAVRADGDADVPALESALRSSAELKSWLAASDAELTTRLADQVSFPERAIADCTRGTRHEAARAAERAATLAAAPSFAAALDSADITTGHVDALTRTAKSLDDDRQRAELFDRCARLVEIARVATIEDFRRSLAVEARSIRHDDGVDRFERQRRDTRLRSWVDGEGMWRLEGRFDPLTGARLAARIDAAKQTLFTEAAPDTCPTDPIEKQRHLAALALARLIEGDDRVGRPGRPEFVVVIDASQPDGAGGPVVDWGIPVEVPGRVLAELAGRGDVHPVVVRNGVVIHAAGRLDLGRTTRLANRAQRRALRGLYATCAVPGCSVHYDRCKLHHVIWWRHGGRTDLDNLLPLCVHHHGKVHDAGWVLTLGPRRELTITFPDGTVHNTGPPTRRAA